MELDDFVLQGGYRLDQGLHLALIVEDLREVEGLGLLLGRQQLLVESVYEDVLHLLRFVVLLAQIVHLDGQEL